MIHCHILCRFNPVVSLSEGVIASLKQPEEILSPTKKNVYDNEHNTQTLFISCKKYNLGATGTDFII